MMLICALLTAVISVNGAVAALIPVVVVTAVQLRTPTSQLMMPLAFAAHAGSMLALTGSPVNVLVSEAADEAGAGDFGFFEFTLVGVPLLVGTVPSSCSLGASAAPGRATPRYMPPRLQRAGAACCWHYGVDGAPASRCTAARRGGRSRHPATFGSDRRDRCSPAW